MSHTLSDDPDPDVDAATGRVNPGLDHVGGTRQHDRVAWSPGRRTLHRLLSGGPAHDRRSPGQELAVFVLTAAVTLIVVATATAVLTTRIASQTALSEAVRATTRLATFVVGPLLSDALAGIPGASDQLQDLLVNRMTDGSLTEIDIWAADGLVVYSTTPGVAGHRHPAPPEVEAAIIDGVTSSGVEETREADSAGLSPDSELEIYMPLQIDGETYAFEAYYDSSTVARQAALLRWQIIPVAVGALALLQLVQIPIARRLAFRVTQHQAERGRLLARSLDASERERRRIAADVHDGPVQELAGIAYALGAVRLTATAQQQRVLDRLQESVREAVGQLRRLMVDIYPPDLSGPGLAVALTDLAGELRAAGIQVDLSVQTPAQVSPDTVATLYRVARETFSNIRQHAGAEQVDVVLAEVSGGEPTVRLTVSDNGVGLPAESLDRRAEGHLGLRLLIDRVVDLGGAMTVAAPPGGGTSVIVTLPTNPGA